MRDRRGQPVTCKADLTGKSLTAPELKHTDGNGANLAAVPQPQVTNG